VGDPDQLGEDPVAELMEWHGNRGRGDCWARTPFWQACHELNLWLNGGRTEPAFLWSNLVKVDEHGSRPDPAVEAAVSRLRLLPSEIRLANPQAVVFFTGPRSDDRLAETFRGVAFTSVPEGPAPSEMARLAHPDLPFHSYRSYHPRFLRMRGRWSTLERIATLVRAG
jgi:hypothetical protein